MPLFDLSAARLHRRKLEAIKLTLLASGEHPPDYITEGIAIFEGMIKEITKLTIEVEGWKTDAYSAEGRHNRAMKDIKRLETIINLNKELAP